jgi:hypothetical protein
MKRSFYSILTILYISIIALGAAAVITSCVSTKGGCYGTSGYVGYGRR